MKNELKLHNNDRVAVIGAGPAGSLFAYSLLRLAKKEKLSLQVTLYDPRDFSRCGPSGCNKCAGVINGSLWQRLKKIGIDLDQVENLIQSRLNGYLWITPAGCLQIKMPFGWQPSRTVFRGCGPRFDHPGKKVGLDDYFLRLALENGAHYQRSRVMDVSLPEKTDQPIQIRLEKDKEQFRVEAELIVGAFGLNPVLLNHFRQLGVGYRPPRYVRAANMELVRRPDAEPKAYDNFIRVHNVSDCRVRQLVLTPKGKYATLTMLSPYDLCAEDLHEIRKCPEMQSILRSGWDWPDQFCHCLPLLLKRSAKNFYGNRIVLVGDAACCRYYKNGLESALHSSGIAAAVAVRYGISRRDFRREYLPRIRREIIHDNFFGRQILWAHNLITSRPALMKLFIQVRSEIIRPTMAREHDDILWDMFTGNRPYRHIFFRIIQPLFILEMALHLGRVMARRLRGIIKRLTRFTAAEKHSRSFVRRSADEIPPDQNGNPLCTCHIAPVTPARVRKLGLSARVSIIGGGPAGTACAIALMKLSHRQKFDLRVTIHESKDFAAAAASFNPIGPPYYDERINPCIGVLSPPIYHILTEKLDIKFPEQLVQKYILGYVLHARQNSIILDELFGASCAVRRIMFDDYMMRQAIECGACLDMATVEQIEKNNSSFKIITNRGTTDADVVVGAFGVDQTVADIFQRCFGYRRPEYMQTIITKRHPDPDFLRRFGLYIHAFLPDMPAVEFGAITPKFNHFSINIAGRNVDNGSMLEFLGRPQVARLLPREYDEKGNETFYSGCFPTSSAANIFADRMVVIGDASGMLRPFKGKGINSAILSGIAAARVMVHRGLTADDFRRYYLPVFRQVTGDLWYARFSRFSTNLLANRGGMDTLLALAHKSPNLKLALAEAVSGAGSYRSITHRMAADRILWRNAPFLLTKLLSGLPCTPRNN